MKITEITNGIHYVGVNDRCKYKFENLWPLPYGVSYNAYLITDKKNVLIDTVDAAYTDRLLDNIGADAGLCGGQPHGAGSFCLDTIYSSKISSNDNCRQYQNPRNG